jgi:type VI secretion system protein ImpL
VDGFTEYFDDLTAAGRTQVWGVTFPYEQSLANEGPQVFPAEFDALMGRLNERVFERIEQVRDPRRRTKVFAFPQQMAAMRDALSQFVTDVFVSSQVDRRILLRGVYFTSGTQDGTPIDRLLGSIGRKFGAADAVMPSAGPGKAYFVESLLKEVMIGESGLAGINRSLEARKAAGLLGAYVAMGLIAAAGVAVFSVSYSRNREYLEQTASQVDALERIEPVTSTAPLERVVPRLDAIKSIVDSSDRYRQGTTWLMRWGLYQGRSIGNAAHGAYMRELDSMLLPRVASQIRRRMIQSAKEPEKLFLYLKGYLMLSDPKHLDKQYLQMLADLDWKPTGVGYSSTGASLSNHLDNLLKNTDTLRPFGVDGTVVRQARASIPPSSWSSILYDEVKRSYGKDKSGDLRIDTLAGLEVEKVFKRRSGVPLSTPMPRLYTREVFKHVTREGRLELIKRYTEDGWVWGQDTLASIATAKNLGSAVTVLYEQDYIKQWDALVDDIEFVSFRTIAETNEALRILTSPTSPLRGLVGVIAANTTLVEKTPTPAASGVIEQTRQKLAGKIGSVLGSAQEAVSLPSMEPGMIVTAHFQPIRELTTGDAGKKPLDNIIQSISEIQQQLDTLGPDAAGADPSQILANQTFRGLLQTLRQQAVALPPGGLRALVMQIAGIAGGAIQRDATGEIEKLYEQQVLPTCRALIANRYPFANETEPDVQLTDFATVFGFDGVFDKFFTDHLQAYVDASSGSWQWRPGSINPSRSLLDQFQAAQRVREMFFAPGSKTPALNFAVTITDLDPNATRFVLQIDGQNFDATHSAPVKRLGVWPGPASGQAATSFEGRFFDPTESYGGPWAWFRMIDASLDGPPDAQQRIRLNVHNRYHQVHVTVEAARAYNNPFATRAWRQFSCES